MKRWMMATVLPLVTSLIFLGPTETSMASRHMMAASGSKSKSSPMQVLGFWANDDSAGLSGLYKYPHSITDFAPFWYSVNATGGLVDRVDTGILSNVRKHHIAVTPLVNDETGTQAFLKSPLTRVRAARAIADMVKAQHFQGVNIDLEPAHTSLAAELVGFMIDLHDFMPHGSVITLDVVPNSGPAYEWSKLTPEVNQFALMSYDEHDDGSEPGPVAATPWVQNILTRMEKSVPSQKIDLGIAVYGYVWPQGSTNAATIPYNAVSPTMNQHAKWDPTDQEDSATYSTSSGKVTAWWESLEGMNAKIQLAKKDHLGGIALWHLGYANDAVYQLLLHQVGTQP